MSEATSRSWVAYDWGMRGDDEIVRQSSSREPSSLALLEGRLRLLCVAGGFAAWHRNYRLALNGRGLTLTRAG